MARNVLSVIVGFVVWTVLWVGIGVGLALTFADWFAEDGSVSATVPLVVFVGCSVVVSLVSGAITALLAKRRSGPVLALAILLLVAGIGFEVAGWSTTPVWYHIVFLVLLVPATLVGGKLAGAGSRAG